MMQLKYSDIPLWLQNSEFYSNLHNDDLNDCFAIPSECYCETCDSIITPSDIANILKIGRFWGLREIPESILEYCYSIDASQWHLIFAEIAVEGTPLYKVIQSAYEHANRFTLDVALSTNRPELVTFWLSKNEPGSEDSDNAMTHAAKFGRLELLKTLNERGFFCDSKAYCAAAQYGQIYVLKYLDEFEIEVDEDAMVHAARGGQVECMKYLDSINASWTPMVTLEYAVPQRYALLPDKQPILAWFDDFSIAPPSNGYINCLRYALEHECPIDKAACEHACRYNLVDCFILLREHGAYVNFLCSIVPAVLGHIDILQHLQDIGYAWDKKTMADAAEGGHLACVQYLHINGSPWNADACSNAARAGNLDILVYFHENGCPWDEDAIAQAARFGHLECLKYLHLNCCSWDSKVMLYAEKGKHFDCIHYLESNGCN